MTQRTRDLFVIPTINAVVVGLLLIPVTAWLTNVPMRTVVRAAGIKNLWFAPLSVWSLFTFLLLAVVWPYVRAKRRPRIALNTILVEGETWWKPVSGRADRINVWATVHFRLVDSVIPIKLVSARLSETDVKDVFAEPICIPNDRGVDKSFSVIVAAPHDATIRPLEPILRNVVLEDNFGEKHVIPFNFERYQRVGTDRIAALRCPRC